MLLARMGKDVEELTNGESMVRAVVEPGEVRQEDSVAVEGSNRALEKLV